MTNWRAYIQRAAQALGIGLIIATVLTAADCLVMRAVGMLGSNPNPIEDETIRGAWIGLHIVVLCLWLPLAKLKPVATALFLLLTFLQWLVCGILLGVCILLIWRAFKLNSQNLPKATTASPAR